MFKQFARKQNAENGKTQTKEYKQKTNKNKMVG